MIAVVAVMIIIVMVVAMVLGKGVCESVDTHGVMAMIGVVIVVRMVVEEALNGNFGD